MKPGFYYMGFVTKRSIESMPPAIREKFKLGAPLSNTKPKATKAEAMREAKAHFLRNISTMQITGKAGS